MSYKDTSEYAYDLMEHFYKIHENQILSLGADNLKVLVPVEIYNLLEVADNTTKVKNITAYPARFHKIEMKPYSGSNILFVLKEVK